MSCRNPLLAHHRDAGQQLGDLLGRVVLAARLARLRRVHAHQELVGVAERVDGVVGEVAQRQLPDGVEQPDQTLVALGDGGAELGAVDVEVVEQALEVVLAGGADRGPLDVAEHAGQGLVEVLVVTRAGPDVDEQLGRQDVEALLLNRDLAAELGLRVAELRVVEVGHAGVAFETVEVGGEVLGDVAVEEHAQHVGLEVPAVDGAPQIVRDPPDRLVQLCPLGFLRDGCHRSSRAGARLVVVRPSPYRWPPTVDRHDALRSPGRPRVTVW